MGVSSKMKNLRVRGEAQNYNISIWIESDFPPPFLLSFLPSLSMKFERVYKSVHSKVFIIIIIINPLPSQALAIHYS